MKIVYHFILGLAFTFLKPGNLLSQDLIPQDSLLNLKRKQQIVIQFEMENGGMLPSNEAIKKNFDDIYYNAANLRVGWQTQRGGDTYHQRYNYPVYGLGIYSATFKRSEIGTPHAFYGFVSIPIRPARTSKWDFNYRISLGLANDFKPYDEENNPLNVLLGSRHNVFIDLALQSHFKLSKKLSLGAGLAFHHFSNGSVKQPNKGINLIPFTVSLSYRPQKIIPDFTKDPLPPFINNSQFHIHYAAGIKQYEPEIKQRYFKSTLGIYWSHSVGPKWRLGAGTDLFYSSSGNEPSFAGSSSGKMKSFLSSGAAFYVDHVLTHNLYINGNIGRYLHKNDFNGEVKPIYLRIGVRYYVLSNTYAGVSIKAHTGKADFIEWTLGHTLGRKNAGK